MCYFMGTRKEFDVLYEARVAKRFVAESAHRLPLHEGDCRFLHGHRYVIHVSVTGSIAPDTGMVADFGAAEFRVVEEYIKGFDHSCILWEKDPLLEALDAAGIEPELVGLRVVALGVQPTAENIATAVSDVVRDAFYAIGWDCIVSVEETEKCSAAVEVAVGWER